MSSEPPAGDPHAPLREDVRLLGELLGETLRAREGIALFETVERVRALAKTARGGGAADLDRLARLLRDLPQASAVPVARAFSHFLTLANIAEQHHRIRRRRDYQRTQLASPQPGSCLETFTRLIRAGISPDSLYQAVQALRIELVLTAHPTAITRRTLVHKHKVIADQLAQQDRPDLTVPERAAIMETLRREIRAAWGTDDVRPERPTPIDEVISGMLIFEQTIWDALPQYVRAVEDALRITTGRQLPHDAAPLVFGSWIGGDRDGNPFVTADVTKRACLVHRWMAADLYLRELEALRLELSMTEGTPELLDRAGGAREPYRAVLREVRHRMAATRATVGHLLGEPTAGEAPAAPYEHAAELVEPLRLCFDSLVATGQELIARGRLLDLLRRTAAFGLTLVRLDIRQHAGKHVAALDAVTEHLGRGKYSEWTEPDRQAFLRDAIRTGSAPPASIPNAEDEVRDVLATFAAAAEIHPESLGAYVISMAQSPSDVLAVEYLQLGSPHRQRVVPLFEQVDTLRGAAETMRSLLAVPEYRTLIGSTQEVMIGYSDSAKDGSRLAANWELYRTQEAIVSVCHEAGVDLTLFHGRGGSIGRGGGPTYLAIQSQPPGSVQGRLRATEQGEMIQAQFGLPEIALRTLEVYTTATVEATVSPGAAPELEWRTLMDRLAGDAHREYRQMVYETPRFIEYFRSATPEVELGAVPIGSRPQRRARPGESQGVESLRAIPWIFAWTQTRLMLPSWLGTGAALTKALERGERDVLRTMYREWPFFRSTMSLMEMVLAKSDAHIAAQYDRHLVRAELQDLGADLRARLEATSRALLESTGIGRLLQGNPVLRRSIDVRNPYVDPINLVQIELLRRIRQTGEEPGEELWRAFMVTVNGIAAGMRNTG